MKPEIKERISQIQKGIVPEGYKKTDFGIFPEDWEQKTFGEIFDFFGSLSKSRDELGDKGIPYLHYGDMHRSDFKIASYSKYLHLPKYDMQLKGTEAYLLNDGDVVFLDASEDVTGTTRSVVVDNPENKPFLAGLHTFVGKEKDDVFDKYYKQYLTLPEYVRKQIMRLAIGFKVYGVNRNEMGKVNCFVPSKPEQKRIADILEKWDKAIELQEQLIEKLETEKKALLQKMLPHKNSDCPEYRLNGFSKPWKQYKLGELGRARSGVGFPEYEQGGISGVPFFKVSDMNLSENDNEMTIANNYVTDVQISKYKWNPIEELPAIFFAKVGAAVMLNRKRICRFPFLLDNNTMAYSLSGEMWDADFAKALFETIDLTTLIQVGALPSYNASTVEQMRIRIPEISEQKRIGVVFKMCDEQITLYKSRLKMEKRKMEALSQLLLTGIVRV